MKNKKILEKIVILIFFVFLSLGVSLLTIRQNTTRFGSIDEFYAYNTVKAGFPASSTYAEISNCSPEGCGQLFYNYMDSYVYLNNITILFNAIIYYAIFNFIKHKKR